MACQGETTHQCNLAPEGFSHSLYWQSKKKTSPILLKSSARLLPGKDQPTRLTWLDESLAWALTEVALLQIYNMGMHQPVDFRLFTEAAEVAPHVSPRFPPFLLKNLLKFPLFTN